MLAYRSRNVAVEKATEADVDYLKTRLRPSDVVEIWAANRETPEMALVAGLKCSTSCWTVKFKGEAVAMFGVARGAGVPDGFGCIWFLASDGLLKMRTTFLKLSRRFVDEMLKDYSVLFNMTDDRNEVAIKWLRWCGADMSAPVDFGPDKRPFRYFEFRRR